MSPLAWIVIGSGVTVIALVALAAVCACVLAGRRDRQIEAHEPEDAGARLLAAVSQLGDDADRLWPESQSAEVIQFPARLRALR